MKVESVVMLKKRLFVYNRLGRKDFREMDGFLWENKELLGEVLGRTLLSSILEVSKMLVEENQQALSFNELFFLDEKLLVEKIKQIIVKIPGKSELNISNILVLRNLFTIFQESVLLISQVSQFKLSSEMKQRMDFCSRSSTKIYIVLNKIRDRKFWRESKTKAIQRTIFPNIFENKSHKKNLLKIAKYQNLSIILKPKSILIMARLFQNQVAGLEFSKKKKFNFFVSKIADELIKKNVLKKSETGIFVDIFSSGHFYRGNKFNLKSFLGRISMKPFDVRVKSKIIKLAQKGGVVFPVKVGKNRNFAIFARIKSKVLRPILEGGHLRKELKALFGTKTGQAVSKVTSFLKNMKRIRVNYLMKDLGELVFKKKANEIMKMSFWKPKALKKYYTILHLKKEVSQQSKLNYFRTMANFLKDLRQTTPKIRYFSKLRFKKIVKLLEKKSEYSRIRQSLQSVLGPKFKPVQKTRFKLATKPTNVRLNFLKGFVSKKIIKSLANKLITQKVLFKLLDKEAMRVKYNKFAYNFLIKHAIVFDTNNLNSAKTLFKVVPYLKIQNKFLQFVEKVKGPFIVKKIVELQKEESSKIKLKKLIKTIAGPLPVRVAQTGKNTANWRMNKFKKFINDFKRTYLRRDVAGKQILLKDNGIVNFIKRMFEMRNNIKQDVPSFLRMNLPELASSGKQLPPPEDRTPPSTEIPLRIVCSCKCCVDFTTCPGNSGCDCGEVQRRTNNDPLFVMRARTMLNINPMVKIHLNVKKDSGEYREYATVIYGGNEEELAVEGVVSEDKRRV